MFEFLRRSYGLGSTDYHNEDDVLLGNIERRDSGNLGEPLDEQDERSQGAKAQKRKRLTIGLQALRRAWTVRFSITAYLLTVVLFSLAYLLSSRPSITQTCSTPACVLAAAELLHTVSSPSQNIDPCTNFRDYVCAGWDSRNELRDDQSQISRRSSLNDQTQAVLRQIMESSGPSFSQQSKNDFATEKRIFAKIKKAYSSCMDETSLDTKGLSPLIDIVNQVQHILHGTTSSSRERPDLGSSQAKHTTEQDNTSLTEAVKLLMNQGVDSLITFRTKIDDEDPSTNSLLIRPVYEQLFLTRDMTNEVMLVDKYKSVMKEVLVQILAKADQEDAFVSNHTSAFTETSKDTIVSEKVIQSLVDFELKLADAIPPLSEWFDVEKYYNAYSLGNAQSLIPRISIRDLIVNQTGGTFPEKVIVTAPAYLKKLSEALHETDRSVLLAYFTWRIIQRHATNVRHELVEPLLTFRSQVEGRNHQADRERWKLCVEHVNEGLGWILGYFWVKWHLPNDIRSFGRTVVSTIRDEYVKQMQSSQWMSQNVKDLAKEKLRTMDEEIAFPTKNPDLRAPAEVEERYSNSPISEHNFFENVISFAKGKNHNRFAKLAKSSKDREWDRNVETVDAYFSPAGNQIVVPGGIMQPPIYYGPRLPTYLTYGSFGALMGHEISHAFDSMGRFFDANRNMTDWWDASTITNFEQKSKCFIKQYNHFSVTNPNGQSFHLDGALTLDENLADDRGLRSAFRAWQTRDKMHPDPKIVGLERFSKEQIFFLSYGKFWCSKMRAEALQTYVRSNVHAPDFARIIGTTANSPEFRSAFSCAVTTPTCQM